MTNNVLALPERFLEAIRPTRHQAKHRIDNADYGRFLLRTIRGWEARVIDDPEQLVTCKLLADRMNEIVNVAIAANAERYAIDPRSGASMAECARILGIEVPSASGRRKKGMEIMARRAAAAGVVRFAEAKRERKALKDASELAAERVGAEYHTRRHLTAVAS